MERIRRIKHKLSIQLHFNLDQTQVLNPQEGLIRPHKLIFINDLSFFLKINVRQVTNSPHSSPIITSTPLQKIHQIKNITSTLNIINDGRSLCQSKQHSLSLFRVDNGVKNPQLFFSRSWIR